ncbi:MAG: TIGR01777 family oxidoreductase [Rhodoluna sp.]|jgi:hypothetical protein|nr:TIGR01777 family oxidoreductase [Rhodoluna sp.]
MRVLISGYTGLVGTEVARQLKAAGHEAIKLERNEPNLNALIETVDAVVNLAGATTGKIPWTKTYKSEIFSSRIDTTKKIVAAINGAKKKPKVLVSGSASGFYGDCGDEWLDESSPKGTGFLSDLAALWETEALKADTRVVLARTTMVMSRAKGALGKLLPLIKLGIGGSLGSGKQWWAFISLQDEAAAIIHLINTPSASGAYNLTAPEPATCAQIVKSLAKGLKRPSILRVPAFAMKLLIGEAAVELLLCSQKMKADRLLATGFKFSHPTLEEASAYVLSEELPS